VLHADGVAPASQTLIEAAGVGGSATRRTMANDRGEFRMTPAPGRCVLRVLRVGYRLTGVDPFVMPAGDTAIRVVRNAQRVVLDRVFVTTGDGCQALRDASRELATVVSASLTCPGMRARWRCGGGADGAQGVDRAMGGGVIAAPHFPSRIELVVGTRGGRPPSNDW
jgi:hypothetical protein